MTVKIEGKIVSQKVIKPTDIKPVVEVEKPKKRPQVLFGETHKLTNHAKGYNLYVTVNYNEGKPFEVFIDSSHTDSIEFVKGIARLCSAMLRTPHFDLEFVAKELMKIHSDQGYHAGGKGGYVAGVVQHIGKTLLHIHKNGEVRSEAIVEPSTAIPEVESTPTSNPCPECGDSMTLMDGCYTCTSCGYSKCG